MPYIDHQRRKLLGDSDLLQIPVFMPRSVGELTYRVTRELNCYLKDKVIRGGGLHYADAAECMAALEGARADFERRILTPLEVEAQARAGDVWSDEVLLALRSRG